MTIEFLQIAMGVGLLAGSVGLAGAQSCGPEVLDRDLQRFKAGEFKGPEIQRKLPELMADLLILRQQPGNDSSDKTVRKRCLVKKDELFANLADRADASIKETPAYQEVVGDYQSFHKQAKAALAAYDLAVKLDPKNLNLLIKDYNAYAIAENINLNDYIDKDTPAPISRPVLEEYARRSEKISEHPDASKYYALESLRFQALAAHNLGNMLQEMSLWEKILSLDPKNEFAMRMRFRNSLRAADLPGTRAEFARLLRSEKVRPEDWRAYLELLAASHADEDYLVWLKKAPAEITQRFPETRVWQVQAYLALGDNQAALAQPLPARLPGPAGELAKRIASKLKEVVGDDLKKQGRLSEALHAYKTAIKNSPNILTLNEKMSLLIYEYRKGLKFKPADATQKDLQEVVDLLKKSAIETELKPSLFAVYLHALSLTGHADQLAQACARYAELYPTQVKSAAYREFCH